MKLAGIIFVISVALFLGCNHNNEIEEYNNAISKAGEEKYEESIKMLLDIIKQSNNEKNIEQCYYSLDSILVLQSNYVRNHGDSQQKKRAPIRHGKNRVSILWGQNYNSDTLNKLIDRRLGILESYVEKYPGGKYKYYFIDELLFLYTKKDINKVKKMASLLLNSPSLEHRKYANIFLASIAHEDRDYSTAIKYYDDLIILIDKPLETIPYILYQADCNYRMNKTNEAISLLECIISLEEENNKKTFTDLSKEWKIIISNSNSYSKDTLVYFY
jgi:hypothetical protein